MHSIRDFIFFNLPWTIFIPLILSIVFFKKSSTPIKCIALYLILSAATQIISYSLWKLHTNNFPVVHVYTILEFLCLLYFYALLLEGFIPQKYFYILAVAFPVFSIIDSFLIEKITSFNIYGRTTEALVFVFLSVCYFIKTVSDVKQNFSSIKDMLYINSGFFIYFSGSVVLFSLSNYINNTVRSMRLNVWTLFTILTAILYLFITIGLWKQKKV